MDLFTIAILAVSVVCLIVSLMVFVRVRAMEEKTAKNIDDAVKRQTDAIKETVNGGFSSAQSDIVRGVGGTVKNMGDMISDAQDKRLKALGEDFSKMSMENEQKLEQIRTSMSRQIRELTEDNNRQIEKMRQTVDEKLQKTLEDRISQSFRLVNERLEQVYKGLGEMQNLASGVGDLKKVLTNVKTRGILGEVQLGAILEQILSPEQYETNVKTKPSGNGRVEFAVKLPGAGETPVYLPIDSKFPGDAYGRLQDAYNAGDKGEIEAAYKALEAVLKTEAKDIRDKYLEPPYTTDFGIMFLPFEGLYAEIVNRGLLEVLQRDYKVNVAGPTTMAALLNSLQMGFKTLAIQKRSGEVWEVLGAVKTEFGKFSDALEAAQKKIRAADGDLDKLIGTRTNVMKRRLSAVEALDEDSSGKVLGIEE